MLRDGQIGQIRDGPPGGRAIKHCDVWLRRPASGTSSVLVGVRGAPYHLRCPDGTAMTLTRRPAWTTLAGAAAVILAAIVPGPPVSASPQGNGAQASPPVPARVEFNRDVRPILSDKCYTCHGPGAQMATLRFDIEAEAKKALRGDRYAIAPNDPEHSVMLARVMATDPKLRMPQRAEPLTAREVELLRRWIAQGATWQKHWAYIPPERPAVPAVRDSKWVRNPIDAFVLARLER